MKETAKAAAWGVFCANGSAYIYQQKETAEAFGVPIPLYARPPVAVPNEPTEVMRVELELTTRLLCAILSGRDLEDKKGDSSALEDALYHSPEMKKWWKAHQTER